MSNPYRFITGPGPAGRNVLDVVRSGGPPRVLMVAPLPKPPIRQLPLPRVLIPFLRRP